MSESFPSVPNVRRYTLSATPDVCLQVQFPSFCRRTTVEFVGAAGKIAFDGVDGAAIDANHSVVTADIPYQVYIALAPTEGRNLGSADVFLASAGASTVVVVTGESG